MKLSLSQYCIFVDKKSGEKWPFWVRGYIDLIVNPAQCERVRIMTFASFHQLEGKNERE